ncbi:hypothetical protein BTM25_21920 [Actinomadura rubteroloni]|uniref:Uncharacterized protein n=1 Tax=Actinomadura rubteroloni TaxID=1926885 RepID=A0A2P4URV6_9ACTN|nr:hypothetical protein [Actinomadura rubteroloni]POM27772.1 hypothetical protein BTM25_21920 [Actinomadura rubteroloni]
MRTVLAAGAALAVTATAGAAPKDPVVTVGPPVVRLVPGTSAPVTVAVDFGTCMDETLIEVEAAEGHGYDYVSSGERIDGRATASFAFDGIETRGRWTVAVSGSVCGTSAPVRREAAASFEIKRDTRITGFGVRARGTGAEVAGRLTRLDPWANRYVPYGGARVQIESRPDGTKPWTVRDTAVTARNGGFAVRVPGAADGAWRAVFPGTRHHADATGGADRVAAR